MGTYGYDETQYLCTEVEVIDKDGFHKKVDASNNSSDVNELLGAHCHGSNFVRIFDLRDENSDDTAKFRLLTRLGWTSDSLYFYFGEPVDDSEITFVKESSESYYVTSNTVTLMSSPGFADSKIMQVSLVPDKYMLLQMIVYNHTSGTLPILPFDKGEKVNLVFVNSEGFTQYTNANEL